jgi:hypothetical protein
VSSSVTLLGNGQDFLFPNVILCTLSTWRKAFSFNTKIFITKRGQKRKGKERKSKKRSDQAVEDTQGEEKSLLTASALSSFCLCSLERRVY